MIPNLTTEQRRENLEKAKAARRRRAAILKGVADGSYSVVDVLNMALEDETVLRMKVFKLIKAAPGYGFARTQQTMRNGCTYPNLAAFKGLGANQRAALMEVFLADRVEYIISYILTDCLLAIFDVYFLSAYRNPPRDAWFLYAWKHFCHYRAAEMLERDIKVWRDK